MTRTTISISDVQLGDKVVLVNDDDNTTSYAVLKDGGKSGGCEHDLFFAYLGDEYEADDDTPYLRTDSEEASKHDISL
jgi:hypothetical protein